MQFFPFLAALFLATTAYAQDAELARAYAANDAAAFERVIQKLSAETTADAPFQTAKAEYAAYAAYQFAHGEKAVKTLMDGAQKRLETYLKAQPDHAEAHALLAGIYGIQIGMSPMKGMTLGSKSSRHLERALELAPDNAFVNYLKGSNLYYTPSTWGGDVAESVVRLELAKSNYESCDPNHSWEYLATLALLGQAYHHQEQTDRAAATYRLALQTEPNFGWVKYELLPKVQR